MISLDPSEETREQYVKNIVSAYQASTNAQRDQGKTWYRNTHMLAVFLDETQPSRAAGVLAAMSQNTRWADNVDMAIRSFGGDDPGHLPDVVDKVKRIMSGESPLDVLPFKKKTWWFYMSIMFPNDTFAVVVDRHAHDIAVGENYGEKNRGLSTQRRYDIIADAYRTAAYKLNLQPMVLQAITWVSHIERSVNR